MSLKRIARKIGNDAVNLIVDVAAHVADNRPMEGYFEEKEIPIGGEELDYIAEMEFEGYVPDFDSHEEAENFNAKLLEDVGRKTEEVERIEAGEEIGYGHEAKSFEGQSDVDYCIECAVKHSNTASMLLAEALQRAEAGDPGLQGVQEKVRGAVRELTGMEDDTETVNNQSVMALNTMARALRKHIYTSKAEIGGASIEDVRDVKDLSDKLVEASYMAREAEEGDCPGCRGAVGIGMGLNVAKALEMPGVDKIETDVRTQRLGANDAMDRIIEHTKNIQDDDATDYLEGVKKMMNTPL